MAKYQYRLSGVFQGAGSPGNAIAALFNRVGSGKRLTIRSVEAQVQYPFNGSGYIKGVLGRGTVIGGRSVTPALVDTSYSVPTGLRFVAGGSFEVVEPLLALNLQPQLEAALLMLVPGLTERTQSGGRLRGAYRSSRARSGSPDVVRFTVRPGETLGLAASFVERAGLWAWDATVRLPSGATFAVSGESLLAGVGSAMFCVVNESAEAAEVVDFGFRCIGPQSVTPYLMVVPVSGASPEVLDTATNQIPLSPMDSAYPDPTSWLQAISNSPMVPFGVPSQYCADAGAGSPKGFNYLSTKDFLGPVYRSVFPEARTTSATNRGDLIGAQMSQKMTDLMMRRASVVVRPGEGIAVVAAAETVSLTASNPVGATPVEVSIVFDVENLVPTYLTLTGLQPGSDVVVLQPGGGPVLASVDENAGSSYTLAYDPDDFSVVDVCVYKPGYIPFSVRNLDLGSTGAVIPVSQIADRNYQ